MRYSYTIQHVPGKSLIIDDMLSMVPVNVFTLQADNELMESANIYVDYCCIVALTT